MRDQRGFTLLEVLVALLVLALSLGAVIQTAGNYTVNQAYLRNSSTNNGISSARCRRLGTSMGTTLRR